MSGSILDQLQRDLDQVFYAVLKKGSFFKFSILQAYSVSLVVLIFHGPVHASENG